MPTIFMLMLHRSMTMLQLFAMALAGRFSRLNIFFELPPVGQSMPHYNSSRHPALGFLSQPSPQSYAAVQGSKSRSIGHSDRGGRGVGLLPSAAWLQHGVGHPK